MRRSTSPIWRPTVSTGLSEVIGSWKTYAMSRAADPAQLGARHREQIDAVEDGAAADDRGLRQQPQERQARDALAAAGLTDDAEHLAGRERERELVDGVHGACRSRTAPKLDDLEQRSGISASSGVEDVAQSVAEQVEREAASTIARPG